MTALALSKTPAAPPSRLSNRGAEALADRLGRQFSGIHRRWRPVSLGNWAKFLQSGRLGRRRRWQWGRQILLGILGKSGTGQPAIKQRARKIAAKTNFGDRVSRPTP